MEDITFREMLPVIIFAVAILVIWWYLIIRPARKRNAEHQETIESIETGDKVTTVGGIQGTITRVREDSVKLKVAEEVVMTLDRKAVRRKREEEEEK